MIGIVRLLLKFTWLGIMVLGARQLVQYLQQGLDEVVSQIDQGEQSGVAAALVKLHNSLHRREASDISSSDVFDEI